MSQVWPQPGNPARAKAVAVPDASAAEPDMVVWARLVAQLHRAREMGLLTDVDHVRIGAAIRDCVGVAGGLAVVLTELAKNGAAAFCHPSGQRDLPVRVGQHRLGDGVIRLGRATADRRNPIELANGQFGVDQAMLRTSMLVMGPPGSGKTRSFAAPIVEHLALQALAYQSSIVVIDPKGDDFAVPGMFDVDIDLANPNGAWGFDLYGGAAAAEEAADRLSSALLPVGVSADKAYFMDASKNALYRALAPFHAAHDRYPRLRELLDLLSGGQSAAQSLRDRLRNRGRLAEFERPLEARSTQRSRRDDPAASLLERLSLLDRPNLVALLDGKQHRFAMRDINRPMRVRLGLPEGTYPEAARMLARLAVAQFVQAASAPTANASIFKGLVIDEAGRYVDEYVTQGVQRLRSRNAGLVLLTQALSDLPEELRPSIFAAIGCKAVFAGANPVDAAYLADYWGTEWVDEVTRSTGIGSSESTSTSGPSTSFSASGLTRTYPGAQRSQGTSSQQGFSVRQVERYRWSASDITNQIPPGHALISLARPDGVRVPPTLVNLRA